MLLFCRKKEIRINKRRLYYVRRSNAHESHKNKYTHLVIILLSGSAKSRVNRTRRAEFATRCTNLSVSTRVTQWVISRFITASCRGSSRRRRTSTLIYLFRRKTARGRRRHRTACTRLEFPLPSRFDHVGPRYRRNRPQELLIFVFITSRDVTSLPEGREDGIAPSSRILYWRGGV